MSGSSSNGSTPEIPVVAAVVVAGGSGQRMGGVRKQYQDLLGQPVLLRALRPFLAHPRVEAVIVVLPADDVDRPPEWLAGLPVILAAGGPERGDSVWSGLQRVPGGTELVLIHDGARPFVTAQTIDRVIEGARSGGAVAAVPATDTVKEVGPEGRIVRTLPRARIWQAQTPQGFPLAGVKQAYERARKEGWADTDDAALCERYGMQIMVVEGDRDNIKITRQADLPVAEAIARRMQDDSGEPALRGR
jgi:2-C-methyl-D-erythritol 4-phosphate cytidylyltransferase